jgi:arylsulfatase A-like enzyme
MASISYADFEVGRLLAETPPDTTIVLWSDHGWHLGPKNHWHKYALWEEASQCVFAMAGPGVKAGVQCARTVSLNDIYPTICELVGLSPPHALAGRSVLPLAANPTAAWNRPALTTYGPDNHAIRSERYRYIRYDDGSEELYDHNVDPHEWYNLATRPESTPIIQNLAPLLPPPVAKKHKKHKLDKTNAPDKKHKKRKRNKKHKSAWIDLPSGRRALLPT